MNPARLVQRKRDGEALTPDEIAAFFRGFAGGDVADYQMSAFLMAVYYRGLEPAELAALVDVMLHSGDVVDLSDIAGAKVDKHSTGGVGDKVSLVLAPLVASLGVVVPMMSGRGLGHSGGTVDKLESIPGLRVGLDVAEYRAQLERIGCALITQTDEIAPLDRRLYALRDVTATVEAIPLIASSIMSKKLAEGIDALVLDVKQGSGAFLPDPSQADALARTMIEIGTRYGKRVVALVTAMDRPLGYAVGNALEVEEAVQSLRGAGPPDLREVTLALAAEMLVLGGAASDAADGRTRAAAALDDGRALDKMREVVRAQGGNVAFLDDPALLPQAPARRVVEMDDAGVVAALDVRAIGHVAIELGAGRRRLEDPVDPSVGMHVTVKPGDTVAKGEPVATVYAASEAAADRAARALRAAIDVRTDAPPRTPLIARRITAQGVEPPP